MSISTTVKGIQGIMRKDTGVDGDLQRIGQIGWLLFLKILDDKETEDEILKPKYKSPIPQKLRWRNWAANREGITGDELRDFLDTELFPTLRELRATPNTIGFVVRSVFEDAYQYMKSGTLIRQVVNRLNEIDFNSSQDRHLFGDIYEEILKDLQSAGNAGEYYTPRAVTQFIVDQIDPQLGETIFDPACGTGGFITSAIERVRENQVKTADDEELLQASLRGVEKKPIPHLLCTTNMLLHNIDVPTNIAHDNTLSRPYKDYGPADRVDVVVTNPPFGGMEEDGIEQNFPKDYRTRETADLFLTLILKILKPGGRCGMVLPDGFLFGEGVKTRIKTRLLKECNLHTIVRLPNGVFAPYTSIKTNLLFFEKGDTTKEIWYYEHPYPPGYKSYSKTKPIRIEEFEPEKAWWIDRKETGQAWRVPIEQIIEGSYNLDLKNPNSPDAGPGDPDELLKEYKRLQAKVEETREKLKRELTTALGLEA